MPFIQTKLNNYAYMMCFKIICIILPINLAWNFIDYYMNTNQPLLNSFVLSLLYFFPITFWIIKPLFSKENSRAAIIYDSLKEMAIVLETDSQGIVKYANSKFVELSGYEQSELLGLNYCSLNAQNNPPNTLRRMWKYFKKHNHWHGEIINKKKNGELYTLDATVIPVFRHEIMLGFILLAKDVTKERKLTAELEMEKSKNMHRSRLESLGEMSAGLAHEMNNPLMIVAGNLSLIKKTIDPTEPKLMSRFSASEKGLERISEILLGLKKYSRSNTSNKDMNVDIEKMIKESISLIKLNPKANEVKISFNFHCPQPIFVLGNECSLEQVFINLLNNSIDALNILDEKWIQISATCCSDFIYIDVVDSGRGIPLNVKDKLFEPFFTTKEVGKGTGLGLIIVQGIINDHQGEIKVNPLTSNTCFSIKLPIHNGVVYEKN